MTGLMAPAPTSSVRKATSAFGNGFQGSMPIFRFPASEINGPSPRAPKEPGSRPANPYVPPVRTQGTPAVEDRVRARDVDGLVVVLQVVAAIAEAMNPSLP